VPMTKLTWIVARVAAAPSTIQIGSECRSQKQGDKVEMSVRVMSDDAIGLLDLAKVERLKRTVGA
jgi:hypothetical protein